MIGSPTFADWVWFISVLGIGQAIVLLPPVKRHLDGYISRNPFSRVFVGLFLGGLCVCAGAKNGISPQAYVAQFVTALHGGTIIDESGTVARASEAAVLEAYTELSVEMVAAASGTVAAASGAFVEVANLVTNTERAVVYIAADLPRAAAHAWTNHNIAATVERVRQSADGETLSMWVWFSEAPSVAPGMCAEIDVGGGWGELCAVTNSYPATESINAVPCVRYDFFVPPFARGTVFRPSYEVAFGAELQPLLVPSGGVTVETNGVTALPFSGEDSYFGGRVEVTYRGGIAAELKIDGVAVTNGVYGL